MGVLCYAGCNDRMIGGRLMSNDDALLRKRFLELAEKAYSRGTYTFTNFLNLAEQDVLSRLERDIAHVPHSAFGGCSGCERVMVRFGDEDLCGYDQPFPIVCVKAEPLSKKFADKLTHRDILGALMNLGIDRAQLGDIILREDGAYLFCTETIAPFVCEHLTRARHTELSCAMTDTLPEGSLFTLESRECLVSSERVDGVTAHVYHLSRNELADRIRAGKLFVNGRQCDSGSLMLKPGDVVSLRGEGRFVYRGVQRTTKSGKLSVVIDAYI